MNMSVFLLSAYGLQTVHSTRDGAIAHARSEFNRTEGLRQTTSDINMHDIMNSERIEHAVPAHWKMLLSELRVDDPTCATEAQVLFEEELVSELKSMAVSVFRLCEQRCLCDIADDINPAWSSPNPVDRAWTPPQKMT